MIENPPAPVNKTELLSRIKTSYSSLFGLVENLDSALLDKSLEGGGWSIKDILAHITSWEDVLIRFHIQAQPFDQVVGLETADYWETSEDETNEHFYRRHRDWSGERVLSYLQATHGRLIEALEALPEERLADPTVHSGDNAQAMSPLINYVIGNTYEHFEEHITMIQKILDHSEE